MDAVERAGNVRRLQLLEPIWTKIEKLEERNCGINKFVIKYLKFLKAELLN